MTGHDGRLRVEGYRCWVECDCGWSTFRHYRSEHDAWTAHGLHADLARARDGATYVRTEVDDD